MIKYLGSKRLLLPALTAVLQGLPGCRRVLDVFSGTARVGHALKAHGLHVVANDHNAYAAVLARCHVEADGSAALERTVRGLIAELSALPPSAGYFTENFCIRARYVQPHNGERIDAIRNRIDALELPEPLRSVMLVSLVEAADRVDSTTGVQMAYLKHWSARSHNRLELRVPEMVPGRGSVASQLDAEEAVAAFPNVDAVYLDPPYNQHSYLGNYHVWETLVRWDAPETYGIANKRVDVRERKSAFNSKVAFVPAFHFLLEGVRARHMVVSFSNEGFVTPEEMANLLGAHGDVQVLAFDYQRYVGAKIGIHNLRGEKVGTVGHLTNKELVFVCSRPTAVTARGA